ncbi:hypothetical protein ACIQXD_29770 [Streptomyces uncialis]|uniref:hypothetical protein n=1 Tax=Streptomyces uncialis TaxID=1048205 RepID=UPI0037F8BB1B
MATAGGEAEPTEREQVKAAAETQIEALRRGETEGVSLWKQRMAAGGYSRTSALPDDEVCQKQWDRLNLAAEYGERNAYQFVEACTDEPARRLMSG